MKIIGKIIGLIIILTISCVNNNSVEEKHATQKKAELLNEFVIVAYSGPPAEEVNRKRYSEIANAGIDIIVPGTFNARQNLRAMNLAQQAGLKVIPFDKRIFPFVSSDEVPIDTTVIGEVINDYKNHPALAGYVIRDEPNANLFPRLRDISRLFRELDPDHEPVINLFPSYASPAQLGFADYRAYVSNFIQTVKPRLLSYDYYALRENVTMDSGWFGNLTIVREEARKANIPFWVFIQSEGIKGYLRVPDRAEILWQVNTALAYGARGIGWFTYWTPLPYKGNPQVEGGASPLVEHHYNAMIDIHGNRTPVYSYVREADLFLRKAGRGLTGWDNTFIARYKGGILIEGSSPIVTPLGNDANLVIGTFKQDDSYRLVISNSSCEKTTGFLLTFSQDWQNAEIFTAIDAKPENKKEVRGPWTLEPGGSVLIDLKPDL